MIDRTTRTANAVPTTIAVVIPSYRVIRHILPVLAAMPDIVDRVYVIDDCCPEGSGKLVQERCTDPRVQVVYHSENKGVGGAVVTGYRCALDEGYDIIVKVDGDGQMDPTLVEHFVMPIVNGRADYTKGNRFFSLEAVASMPRVRLFGNAGLSFMSKLSTGYWRIFDPTNGYTAIHREVLQLLPLEKLPNRYFFESEVLFRLGTIGAAVVDVPMRAQYGDEVSGLSVKRVLGEFARKHIGNTFRRFFYSYVLRDFSVATLELLAGTVLVLFGFIYGGAAALSNAADGVETPAGTIAVATVSVILGVQLLLAFLAYDISKSPRDAIYPYLSTALRPRATTPAPEVAEVKKLRTKAVEAVRSSVAQSRVRTNS